MICTKCHAKAHNYASHFLCKKGAPLSSITFQGFFRVPPVMICFRVDRSGLILCMKVQCVSPALPHKKAFSGWMKEWNMWAFKELLYIFLCTIYFSTIGTNARSKSDGVYVTVSCSEQYFVCAFFKANTQKKTLLLLCCCTEHTEVVVDNTQYIVVYLISRKKREEKFREKARRRFVRSSLWVCYKAKYYTDTIICL